MEGDDDFLNQFLFSDEAVFHLSGEVNRHNCVCWSPNNPSHTTMKPLQSPKIIVWMGVWSGGLVGPYVFDATVNGERRCCATGYYHNYNKSTASTTARCFSSRIARHLTGRVPCVTGWTLPSRIPGSGEAVRSAGRRVRQI